VYEKRLRMSSGASSPGRARSSAAAALSGSLPSARADKRRREEQDEGGGADSDDDQMINNEVYREFDEHVKAIAAARDKKRERLAFKSAAEEPDEAAGGGAKVETEDQRDQLGEWLPGDQYQGQVNMRTLKQLLGRIDARGFERCASNRARALCVPGSAPAVPLTRSAQQLEFHEAFFRACGRVIYKDNWATDKPQIMKAEGWTKCNSEVLISTPRRFVRSRHLNPRPRVDLLRDCPFAAQGKTFSIVRRLPAHAPFTHRLRIRRPSSAPASPSRWAWRSSYSRQPGVRAASCSSASSSKLRFFKPQTRVALRRGCAGSCGSRAASRGSSSSTWRRAGSTPSTGARASSAAFLRRSGCATGAAFESGRPAVAAARRRRRVPHATTAGIA
jgi:hypothetical protein